MFYLILTTTAQSRQHSSNFSTQRKLTLNKAYYLLKFAGFWTQVLHPLKYSIMVPLSIRQVCAGHHIGPLEVKHMIRHGSCAQGVYDLTG